MKRVESLDVMRGTAMIFVCLAHFSDTFLAPWEKTPLSPLLRSFGQTAMTVSMVASPTFVAISGIVVAYLFTISPYSADALRRKLIDRGLFLLLVGHLLQCIPAFVVHRAIPQTLRFAFITDVIGVAIIIGPSLVLTTSPGTRQAIGALLLVASWVGDCLLGWSGHTSSLIVRYGLGPIENGQVPGFPLVPWFGVYLLATTFGERLGASARAGGVRNVIRLLARVGSIGLTTGIGVRIVVHGIRLISPQSIPAASALSVLLSADQKFPPSPTYLLFFGGLGMLVMASALWLACHERWAAATRPLAAMGRASFFVYILQRYVYYLLVPELKLPYPSLWLLYFTVSIGLLAASAALFNSIDGNRFLTVGLWKTWPLVRAFQVRIRTNLALH